MKKRSLRRPAASTSMGYAAKKALSELRSANRLNPEAYVLRKAAWLSVICDHLKGGIEALKQEFKPATICFTSVRAIKRSFTKDGQGSQFTEAYHTLILMLKHNKGTKQEVDTLRHFLRRMRDEFYYHRLA